MNLLIAEKPSVALSSYKPLLENVENESFRKKDGYLEGRNWYISWCFGHLVGLAMPEDYGWEKWTLDNMPMIPSEWKFKILPSSSTQFKILKSLIGRSSLIVNGTDAGREGELIYRWLVFMAGAKNKPQKRLWASSFVINDLVNAWNNVKPLQDYDNLYHSATSRALGDWLVGLNATRGYVLKTGVGKLSVGRVQTPTLALIVKRDEEVENWKQIFYYQLSTLWKDLPFLYVQDSESNFETLKLQSPLNRFFRPAKMSKV